MIKCITQSNTKLAYSYQLVTDHQSCCPSTSYNPMYWNQHPLSCISATICMLMVTNPKFSNFKKTTKKQLSPEVRNFQSAKYEISMRLYKHIKLSVSFILLQLLQYTTIQQLIQLSESVSTNNYCCMVTKLYQTVWYSALPLKYFREVTLYH